MLHTIEDICAEKSFPFLTLQSQPLSLNVSSHLFMPNQTTAAIADAVTLHDGEEGIEIGAGVGPLTIMLASQPIKHLYTIELVQEQWELAQRNIQKYNLQGKVTSYHGSIFDPIAQHHPNLKVDFIVSDISGMAEEPARKLGWYPPLIPTGGADGTQQIIPLIEQAPNYLKPQGRLYFPVVINFSDSDAIKRTAQEKFQELELVNHISMPLTKEMVSTIESMCSGIYADIERKGSRGYWHLEVWEATKPRNYF